MQHQHVLACVVENKMAASSWLQRCVFAAQVKEQIIWFGDCVRGFDISL